MPAPRAYIESAPLADLEGDVPADCALNEDEHFAALEGTGVCPSCGQKIGDTVDTGWDFSDIFG